jgi:hypothetical protein
MRQQPEERNMKESTFRFPDQDSCKKAYYAIADKLNDRRIKMKNMVLLRSAVFEDGKTLATEDWVFEIPQIAEIVNKYNGKMI